MTNEADVVRALGRIFDAARERKLPLGPVMRPEDFLLYPERLADAFDEAMDPGRTIEERGMSIAHLQEIESDLQAATYNIRDAIAVARKAKKAA